MGGISVPGLDELRAQLRERGFCVIVGSQLELPRYCEHGKAALKHAFAGGRSDGPTRLRYYGRYLLTPNSARETLDLQVGSGSFLSSDYRQGADLNPEQRGALRRYMPLPEDLWNSELLRELILFDRDLVLLDDLWANARRSPIAVGVHLIRMIARPGKPAAPSPSVPHQDGEPFTCIHLIDRQGVQGGLSQIFRNVPHNGVNRAGELMTEVVLANIFDTLVVWDKEVFHHVTALDVSDGSQVGTRDVLIVDFTPLEECKFNAQGELGIPSGVFRDSLRSPAWAEAERCPRTAESIL
jgi:hypothetical protein